MDGTHWNYFRIAKDDGMPVLKSVSLSRDRGGRPDTHITTSFTGKQLDAVAPLSKKDVMSIRDGTPTRRAIQTIQRRIEAACNIKYRTLETREE